MHISVYIAGCLVCIYIHIQGIEVQEGKSVLLEVWEGKDWEVTPVYCILLIDEKTSKVFTH